MALRGVPPASAAHVARARPAQPFLAPQSRSHPKARDGFREPGDRRPVSSCGLEPPASLRSVSVFVWTVREEGRQPDSAATARGGAKTP